MRFWFQFQFNLHKNNAQKLPFNQFCTLDLRFLAACREARHRAVGSLPTGQAGRHQTRIPSRAPTMPPSLADPSSRYFTLAISFSP